VTALLAAGSDQTLQLLQQCGGQNFCLPIFFHFLFDPRFIQGAEFTIWLAVVAQAVGVGLGLISALLKISKNPLLNGLANFYIWLFRGTPLLVQLSFFFNALPFLPGPWIVHLWPPSVSLSPGLFLSVQVTAVLALGLNEGAYMSEIIRAGIESIDTGQMEAARALGMTYLLAMRRIVLPQAARVIVPPLGNEFNNMLKTTSLIAIISGEELFRKSEELSSETLRVFEIYAIVAIYYLAMTTTWTLIQMWIESRLGASRGTGARGRRWLPLPSGRRLLGVRAGPTGGTR
jgi:polar amino acid transport system permease protein